jgi:uncharacterized protein YbaP (TraB family)
MELTNLSLQSDEMGSTMEMEHGVESVLQWELPKERKGYLETPGQQFDMLAGGPVEDQIQQLFMVIDEGGLDGGETLADLVKSWVAGDVAEIEMKPKNEDEAAVLEVLLNERNKNWLPLIETMLRDNADNLIIVGAAHLVGEDNVLDLLTAAGYRVNRIQ